LAKRTNWPALEVEQAFPPVFEPEEIYFRKEFSMFGKLAGAWLGNKMASRNSGAKGAILGYGAAALAKRGLGPLAVGAAALWGFNKLRDRRNRAPRYPSEASPSSL
jgi:hypothetical protein